LIITIEDDGGESLKTSSRKYLTLLPVWKKAEMAISSDLVWGWPWWPKYATGTRVKSVSPPPHRWGEQALGCDSLWTDTFLHFTDKTSQTQHTLPKYPSQG